MEFKIFSKENSDMKCAVDNNLASYIYGNEGTSKESTTTSSKKQEVDLYEDIDNPMSIFNMPAGGFKKYLGNLHAI